MYAQSRTQRTKNARSFYVCAFACTKHYTHFPSAYCPLFAVEAIFGPKYWNFNGLDVTLNLERQAEYKWQGRVFCFWDRGIMTVRVEKRAAKDLRKICYLSADWDIVTRPGAFYSHWGLFHLFTRFSTLMSCRYVTCGTNVSTDCITFTEHRTLRLNYGNGSNGSNGSSVEWINLNPT